ncbi:MAG TPA: acyl-CoA dehydratase activase, partial [Deltaproteobacteria bacterium]|nr:acyl-CoA dehydratase activase [Deltaproteobacteria bacterium]
IGSLSCDAVLLDGHGRVVADAIVPTGAKNAEAIALATELVLNRAGATREKVKAVVSTGYGRDRVEGRLASVTEITCHARGMRHLNEKARILIDIGGQDSKCIPMSETGAVVNFAMNDKCAAGTGRFLEAMARVLQVDIDEMGELDRGARGDVTISSICTVFAESEVVSLIARGENICEIALGLNRSIASRTVSLVKRVAPDIDGMGIAMSGGVARNRGVVRALEEALGRPIFVPEAPDLVGALGAALFALERGARRVSRDDGRHADGRREGECA